MTARTHPRHRGTTGRRRGASRAVAAGTLLLVGAALVGTAPTAGATDVSFTLDAGPLSIVQPVTPVSLGSATQSPSGATVSASIGATTVNDSRGVNLGWTSSIAMTQFSSPSGAVLPASSTKAFVPAGVSTTGVITASAGTRTSADNGVTLGTVPQTLVTGMLAVGINSATFAPTVTVTVPASLNPGTYTAVITQTVS